MTAARVHQSRRSGSRDDVIASALQNADYFRRSPFAKGGPGGHKEWLHFCVYGAEVDVLVNFSLCDDVTPNAPVGREFARTTVLVREDSFGWDGEVELHDPATVAVHDGKIHARFGRNEVVFRDGAYFIFVEIPERELIIELALRPATMPSLANNIQLDPGPPINWLVAPRLFAQGFVEIRGRHHHFDEALAYHDHNWGHFAWGRDFAWEWGFGLPHTSQNPWSMVFVRLSDRAHTRSRLQALFLWKGMRQQRVFRDADLTIEHAGQLRPKQVFKLPRPMTLIAPDLLPDVPQRLLIRADGEGDHVECIFEAQNVAQVIIPNDHDFGVTIINEVSGTAAVAGRVRGEEMTMEGRAIFEFLGA